MGYKQTSEHRFGKASYHQIGLVRGQFGNVPMDGWIKFLQDIRLRRLGRSQLGTGSRIAAPTMPGPRRMRRSASIWPASTGWKSSPSPLTCKGRRSATNPAPRRCNSSRARPIEAYKSWRAKGHNPPRTNPYYVPDEVGKLVHEAATRDLLAIVRLAHYLGKLQNRKVPVPGFVGSPAHCWSHFFLFPPLPSEIGGHKIPDVREVSLELLVERFGPVLDACKKYGVTFDLECHPSERAMGDWNRPTII